MTAMAPMTAQSANGGAPGPLGAAVPRDVLERALQRAAGPQASLLSVQRLAGDRGSDELKQAGYGEPLLLHYRTPSGEHDAVFRMMLPNWFGHDRRADRAELALLAAETYERFPRHVKVLDVGALGERGDLVSLSATGEFYLITTYAQGTLYARDLQEIAARKTATMLDVARARALCQYLIDLHKAPLAGPPELYARAIRDLVGSGEGIFGLVDSYPLKGPVPPARVEAIEARCVAWRHRLRRRGHRLRRTHGDFHPYNVLFREQADFTLLDASRGGVGEPADDVAAMAINYLFWGMVVPGAWQDGLKPLWDGFWSTYLSSDAGTGDQELLDVVAPFLAWRALVLASPVWYPRVPAEARERMLSFAEAALDTAPFTPDCAALFAV